jgi:hypothetical protein
MPLLSTSNCYALLDVDSVEENSTLPSKPTDEAMIVADIQSTPPTPLHPVYFPPLEAMGMETFAQICGCLHPVGELSTPQGRDSHHEHSAAHILHGSP